MADYDVDLFVIGGGSSIGEAGDGRTLAQAVRPEQPAERRVRRQRRGVPAAAPRRGDRHGGRLRPRQHLARSGCGAAGGAYRRPRAAGARRDPRPAHRAAWTFCRRSCRRPRPPASHWPRSRGRGHPRPPSNRPCRSRSCSSRDPPLQDTPIHGDRCINRRRGAARRAGRTGRRKAAPTPHGRRGLRRHAVCNFHSPPAGAAGQALRWLVSGIFTTTIPRSIRGVGD